MNKMQQREIQYIRLEDIPYQNLAVKQPLLGQTILEK